MLKPGLKPAGYLNGVWVRETWRKNDHDHLAQLVSARTGLPQADADRRVAQVLSESRDAAAKARQSAVILAFTLAAALAAGAAAAWGAAVIGGQHRDENFAPSMRFSWGR
jgi:ferric-dicitrate binding protein FerR (iron transport regulator)